MATDLKSIQVLEFNGKITNWEGWSVKFLARGMRLGHKKLQLGKVKIPTQSANPENHGFGRAYIKR